MNNHQEQVEKLLYKLAQFTLSRYIGVDRLDRIEQAGLTLNTELMCEVLYSIKGINIFKDKDLRYDLLTTLDPEVQNSIVSNGQSISEGLASFNNFSWGKNQKSKEFLRVFKLDGFEITKSSKSIDDDKKEI